VGCGVSFLMSSRSSSGLLFSAGVWLWGSVMCACAWFGAFGFLWEREQVCDQCGKM